MDTYNPGVADGKLLALRARSTRDPFTEDALALRFSERHAEDLRYIAAKAQWLKWDGDRWQPDATHLAFDLAAASTHGNTETESPHPEF